MHILSLSDIQLIIRLFEQRDVMSDANGREQQVYHLIKLGYLRPLRGIYALTELGEKTARSLQMRQFVPSNMRLRRTSTPCSSCTPPPTNQINAGSSANSCWLLIVARHRSWC